MIRPPTTCPLSTLALSVARTTAQVEELTGAETTREQLRLVSAMRGLVGVHGAALSYAPYAARFGARSISDEQIDRLPLDQQIRSAQPACCSALAHNLLLTRARAPAPPRTPSEQLRAKQPDGGRAGHLPKLEVRQGRVRVALERLQHALVAHHHRLDPLPPPAAGATVAATADTTDTRHSATPDATSVSAHAEP